jgi:hypothetical protein
MLHAIEARSGESRLADPHFEDFLADPMIRLLMRQDHVLIDDARRLYAEAAAKLRERHNRRAMMMPVSRLEQACA